MIVRLFELKFLLQIDTRHCHTMIDTYSDSKQEPYMNVFFINLIFIEKFGSCSMH